MIGSDLGVVLVTGGAGFIGCALSNALSASASRWVALDSLHPQVHAERRRPDALAESAELIVGDVSDDEVWDEVLRQVRPDTVFHFAAETGTAQSLHEASRHSIVNVVGTAAMLDAFGRASHRPGRVFLSSSRAVYGEGQWIDAAGNRFVPGQRSHAQFERGEWDFPGSTPIPSTVAGTWPTPTSVYGATKLAQEQILSAWAGAHDVPLGILRLQNVYGPGQSLINSYTGIVSLFSQWAAEGRAIPVYEDGLITRDFVYIDDVVAAFVALASMSLGRDVVRYDVGSGVASTIMELAEQVARYHDAPAPHVTGQYRDGDVRYAACDIAPTVEALGWQPEWSLERGIAALQKWIAAQS